MRAAVKSPLLLLSSQWSGFCPTIISLFRNRKNIGKIFLLNIPLGLTFIPWLILLGWSLSPKISFEQLKEKLRGRKRETTS